MENQGIEIRHIQKSYRDVKVFSDLSLSLKKGSRTIFMGPSGCGKTTLLRMLMGLEKADAGEICGIPEKKSAVFQENRLCEGFSAVKNIEMVPRLAACPSAEKLLAELGLGDEQNLTKPVRELSGGMQRRTAIARAMTADAEILFLDEPFQGLDAENHRMTAEFILRYLGERTLVVVSHNPQDAELLHADIVELA